MARTAAVGTWLPGPVWARAARLCAVAIGFAIATVTSIAPARADDPVPGEATFTAANGFARLVFKLKEDVESEVTTAGSIVVIRFKRPVDIPVDKLADAVPDYVGAVRRDPDGSAIRFALARRVTINTMSAGERTFVDFMPDGWTGPPPTLPQDVIRELAERARNAERLLRQQRAADAAKKRPPIRLRALVQPTFVRYVLELPNGVNVSSVLNDQKLTLSFNAPLNFDLADAKIAMPPNISAITARADTDTSAIDMVMIGDVDVHSFRDEKNYLVDVAVQHGEQPALPGPAAALSPMLREKPKAASAQQTLIAPLTSESFAREAKIEIKPAQPKSEAASTEPAKAEAKSEAKSQAAPPESSKAESAKAEPAKSESAPTEKPAAAQNPVEPGAPHEGRVEAEHAAVPEAPKPPPAAAAQADAPKAMPAPVQAPPREATTSGKAAAVDAQRDSDGLRVTFSFQAATPAAMFRRADAVWIVFDTSDAIDLDAIRAKSGALISDVSRVALDKGEAVRFRLNRPQLPSLESDDRSKGTSWTVTFADRVQKSPLPLSVVRNVADPALANISVPLANPGRLHRLVDPDAGDVLWIVTAPPPTRGIIRRQDFVELSLLESVHGLVIHPNCDDVKAEIGADKVMIGRPGGLTLSSADVAAERATAAVKPLFDTDEWKTNQSENFVDSLDGKIRAIASANPEQVPQARLDLADLLMARGMYPEAHAVTNLILSESKHGSEDPPVVMVHAVASILMGHPAQGLKDLANPVIGNGYDSQLWKALALARQGNWTDAREKFKNAEFSVATLPADLQRIITMDAMKASLEVKDYSGAARRKSDLDVIGVPNDLKPAAAVLKGRLAEALGQEKDALDAYRFAVNSGDRQAAAEGKLLEVLLRQKRGEINQDEVLKELELLSMMWRGDTIELKTLAVLAKIYSATGRYAEAFAATRTATRLQPNSPESRQAQDAASALFTQLFLGPKGDEMSPIDALGTFYEYRELTPIGSRGDEMIRRLADRLVGVDLLDQAADLLQYQVDKRLDGAARAQVAARLATIYLMNHKPDRAIGALRSTRIADLSGELRQQRLLLEARAQSDVGRHDLALDIISNLTGREAIRLRADIYWAARRWRESSEQIELYYGDRWRDFTPLNPSEKSDVIRAVVGYSLAEDAIGLARFREKYAPLMSGEADKVAFDAASKPVATSSAEFADIAKMAARVDTMDGFIREMKGRFPDGSSRTPDPVPTGSAPDAAKAAPVSSLPAIKGEQRASAAE